MGGKTARVKRYIGMLMMVAVIVWFFSFALRNPDMTRTRLLLTYWRHYICGTMLVFVGLLLAGEAI